MHDDDNLSKPLMSLRDIAAHNSHTDHDLHRMRLLDILDIDSGLTLIFDLLSPVGASGEDIKFCEGVFAKLIVRT